MKHKNPAKYHTTGATMSAVQTPTAIVPSPTETARSNNSDYVNESSWPGHEEQEWLEAEARLNADIANGSDRQPSA